jgi:hypothetical protein
MFEKKAVDLEEIYILWSVLIFHTMGHSLGPWQNLNPVNWDYTGPIWIKMEFSWRVDNLYQITMNSLSSVKDDKYVLIWTKDIKNNYENANFYVSNVYENSYKFMNIMSF